MRDGAVSSNFLAKILPAVRPIPEFSPENSPAADREVTRG
jgi:hypothetical protein